MGVEISASATGKRGLRIIRMNRNFLVLERSILVEWAVMVGCVALLLGVGLKGWVEELGVGPITGFLCNKSASQTVYTCE